MAFNLVGKAVRRIRLPIVDYNAAPITIIPVQEGDVNSRFFEISLYDDNGDVDLSVYNRAILSGETASGIVLTSTRCEIADNGKSVTVVFGGGFTAQAGRVACNVTFTNGEEPSSLTSQTFYVIVSQSQAGRIITENQDDYNALLSLIKELDGVEKQISEAERERAAAEDGRRAAENDRMSGEAARAEAEELRNNAEQIRDNQEDVRIDNENVRQSNEAERIAAENNRAEVELARVEIESQRVLSEAVRKINEESRSSAEQSRVTAEGDRERSETQRSQEFSAMIGDCESAIQHANDVAQEVRDIVGALPCHTNKVDGETMTEVVALNFVAFEG